MEPLVEHEVLLRAIARLSRAQAGLEGDLWCLVQEAREVGVPVSALCDLLGCSRATLYRRIGGDPF